MATSIQSIPGIERNISGMQKQESDLQRRLNTSSSPTGSPSYTDLSHQTELERIQKSIRGLQDQRRKTKWYGTDAPAKSGANEGETKQKQGLISKGLDVLSRPLYGVVGGVKYATGKGTGSLYQSMADNMMRNKDTFGDVLSQSNVPYGVAAPLGFALDLALDPVNWATMGTAAFVPRVATGAFKAFRGGESILKGLTIAGKSNLLEKAVTIGKYTPYLSKTEKFAKLAESAIASTRDWERFSGATIEHLVANSDANLLGFARKTARKFFDDAIEASPKAQSILQHFVYDPVEWVRQARIKDIFQQTLGKYVNVSGAVSAQLKGDSIEPFLREAAETYAEKIHSAVGLPEEELLGTLLPSDPDLKKFGDVLSSQNIEAKMVSAITKEVDDGLTVMKDATGKYISSDGYENTARLLNESLVDAALRRSNETLGGGISLEEVKRIVDSGVLNQTGVKWFDNMMEGVKDFTINLDRIMKNGKTVEVGKNTLDWYSKGMAIFRVAKVAASPSAWTNAVVGNLLMTHMAGGNIGPVYLNNLMRAKQLYYGDAVKSAAMGAQLDRLFILAGGGPAEDFIRKALANNRTAARNALGDLRFLGDAERGIPSITQTSREELSRVGRDMGIISGSLSEEELNATFLDIIMKRDAKIVAAKAEANIARRNLKEAQANLDASIDKGEALGKFAKTEAETTVRGVLLPTESNAKRTRELIAKKGIENVSTFDKGGGLTSQELYSSEGATEIFNRIAEKAAAEPTNKSVQVLNFIFNTAPEGYEKVDQGFKLATFLTATVDGYTKNELIKISKFLKIDPKGIREVLYDPHSITALNETGNKLLEVRYTISPKNALELGGVMYLNYAAMPAAVKVLRNLPLLGSPFASFMYGMTVKTGQTMVNNPAAFNKVGFALSEFGGQPNPLEEKALKTSPYYAYLNQPGMMRIPFFQKNPLYINVASMIPYYSLNMFNPTKTSYGNSAREQVTQLFQSSPLMKDPLGSTLFDYFIQPLILGEAIRPQGQFGQPLYPLDASLLEKAGYGTRTLAEAVFPNMLQYGGTITGLVAPGMAEYVPSYRWRSISNAIQQQNAMGISSKEPAAQRWLREMAKASGIPVQSPVNTGYVAKDNLENNN